MKEIIKLSEGDILFMKKDHPCGENRFLILRTGSDVRIRCCRCAREITLSRLKLEKLIKKAEPYGKGGKTGGSYIES